jgi:hypothetical protein
MTTDESKRRRRGPSPLDPTEKRTHSISTRLNDIELALLDARRQPMRMQRGEYLRAAALHRLPPTIPEINREAWVDLARAAANLNQIAHRLNAGDAILSADIRVMLEAFRRDLIGVKRHHMEDIEDESES